MVGGLLKYACCLSASCTYSDIFTACVTTDSRLEVLLSCTGGKKQKRADSIDSTQSGVQADPDKAHKEGGSTAEQTVLSNCPKGLPQGLTARTSLVAGPLEESISRPATPMTAAVMTMSR